MARTPKVKHRLTVGDGIVYLLLTLFALYTLSPLYFLVVNSFKPQQEIVRNPVALPDSLNFQYIREALEKISFLPSLLLTATITALSIGIIVVAASLAAWILVRNKSKASSVIFLLFVAAMLIPFQAIMYPLISFMESLGLKNLPGLVLMYGGFGLSLSVFLYHGFIKSIPQGIEEAALIDGANMLQMFFRVVFPLLRSVTVTVIILNGMWIWNDYLLPFLVIGNSPGVKTLTLELYFAKILSGQFGNPWQLIFPAVFVSILPIVVVFLCLQKYFIRGITEGAIKT